LNKNPSNPENIQDAYTRVIVALKQLEEQVPIIQNQLGLVYSNIETYEIAKNTVESMKELKENDEILIPIGNIMYFKAKIQDPSSFIVNVGADISIIKTPEETVEFIDKNIEMLNNTRQQIEADYQRLLSEIQDLQQKKEDILREVSSQTSGQFPSG